MILLLRETRQIGILRLCRRELRASVEGGPSHCLRARGTALYGEVIDHIAAALQYDDWVFLL